LDDFTGSGGSLGQQEDKSDELYQALHRPPTTVLYRDQKIDPAAPSVAGDQPRGPQPAMNASIARAALAADQAAMFDNRRYWQDMKLSCCPGNGLRSGIRSVAATNIRDRRASQREGCPDRILGEGVATSIHVPRLHCPWKQAWPIADVSWGYRGVLSN
jgi:hypothetical protein